MTSSNESARLRTLAQYAVVDAPPKAPLNRIVRLARRLFDVPIALVNFIDRDQQWCVAGENTADATMSRDLSFCTHLVDSEAPFLVVEDTRDDARFANHPMVTGGLQIRFYAGAPLVAPNGHRLGSLCLIDHEPHTFDAEDRALLADLAHVVMDEINMRHYAFHLGNEAVTANRHPHATRILESITDAFVAIDASWRFTYVNRHAEDLLGQSRDALLGRKAWAVLPEALDPAFRQQFERAAAEQTTVAFTDYYPPLARWLALKIFPFPGGLTVYFNDVTEQVEQQRALEDAKEAAERSSRLKSSFLTNLSHDVRTPLASIMNSTKLLEREVEAALQPRVALIQRSSERLLATINAVLDFSKLEAGSVTPAPRRVDVADEVLGTVECFQAEARAQDITLRATATPDVIEATLCPSCLHRIADHLVSNALTFTDAGGRVTVTVEGTEETVRMCVADTGPGIAEDFQDVLFEPFTRNDDHSGREGTGLGLAICHRLTELMGGTITMESTDGEGATFVVTLPRAFSDK
ncbi:GAF domain-containing sensor histidine kinase [Salisaeta longa]|uniref:GAF domain-containing sensor histidine kinase n=1 Tax=Salisaeta longa TaxID=503170 RepID=UPI0003B5D76D|nr:ATP-binding protein [Salisaeta longa]